MLKGLGQLGDMAGMVKKAQQMQTRLAELQEELATVTVSGQSGAGLVRTTATAKGELVALEIDESIFNQSDKEVAEDLIVAAVKDVQEKARHHSEQAIATLSQEIGLPADMKLPF